MITNNTATFVYYDFPCKIKPGRQHTLVLLQDQVGRCSPEASNFHNQQKQVKILSYNKENFDKKEQ